MLPPPIVRIPHIPSNYRPRPHRNRQTLSVDTDAGGRRLGEGLEVDHDGMLSDKDVLPAYDGKGGPPKYLELDVLSHGRMGMVDEGIAGEFGSGGGTGTTETGMGAQISGTTPEVASPYIPGYPNAPPGNPDSPTVDAPALPSAASASLTESAMLGSDSNVPPLHVHAVSSANSSSPP
jgi:hypothetical protein